VFELGRVSDVGAGPYVVRSWIMSQQLRFCVAGSATFSRYGTFRDGIKKSSAYLNGDGPSALPELGRSDIRANCKMLRQET
jgi:hypothetical protein